MTDAGVQAIWKRLKAIRPPEIPPATRKLVLLRANGCCEDCGRKLPLELHHLHYDTVGREEPCDLDALCRECHKNRHIDLNGDWWNDPSEKESYWEGYYHEMEKD